MQLFAEVFFDAIALPCFDTWSWFVEFRSKVVDKVGVRAGCEITTLTRYGPIRGTARQNLPEDRALIVDLPHYAAPQVVPYDYILTVTPPTPEPEAP